MGIGLIGLSLNAQAQFARGYGGTPNDSILCMILASDGGYALVGKTTSGAGGYDVLVMKLTSSGALSWAKAYGGTGDEWGYSITQTTDGGYAVAGFTKSGLDSTDFLVFRLDASGNLAWSKRFGGVRNDTAFSIIQTADQGYAVVGRTMRTGQTYSDALMLKLDASGSLVWSRGFGMGSGTYGTYWDDAYSVIQTEDGGYAILVCTRNFSATNSDYLVVKLSASGTFTWATRFGPQSADTPRAIIQTSDGGYLSVGWIRNTELNYYHDMFAVKLNASGTPVWYKSYGTTNYEAANSGVQSSDGGYVLAGWRRVSASDDQFLIIKIDPSGNFVWGRTFGGAGREWAYSVVPGSYAIGGWSESYGSNNDALVLKLDDDGNYRNCVDEITFSAYTPTNFAYASLSNVGEATPSVSEASMSLATTDLTRSPYNICEPVYEGLEESSSEQEIRITCAPVPGGISFFTSAQVALKIYTPEGQLAFTGTLGRGCNRINMDPGVYIWEAGPCRGKVVVR